MTYERWLVHLSTILNECYDMDGSEMDSWCLHLQHSEGIVMKDLFLKGVSPEEAAEYFV